MVRLFAIAPLGIGLSIIGLLWLSPFGEFHSPPLFVRVFGSSVALPFVLLGLGGLFGKLPQQPQRPQFPELLPPQAAAGQQPSSAPPNDPGAYRCPRCSAPLGKDADVSPMGDVKCPHCNGWFNVHQRTPA